MTREAAKAIIKAIYEEQLKDEFLLSVQDEVMTKVDDAFKVVFELLDNEPCEDAVSRQAMLDMMQMRMSGKELYKAAYDLPPVTPTRKKGKWIAERDDYGNITGWHCSNCYDETGFVTTCAWDYCPKCGAEMESEE